MTLADGAALERALRVGEHAQVVVEVVAQPRRNADRRVVTDQAGELVEELDLSYAAVHLDGRGRPELADALATPDLNTSNPVLVVERLVVLPATYRIVGGPEVRAAAREIAARLSDAAT